MDGRGLVPLASVRPVVCLITDRRRFGTRAEEELLERVRIAARAGVHLVQIRERDLEGGRLYRLVTRAVAVVRTTATRIIVNERADVAIAAGAHGVHLRGDSMPARRVRPMVPEGFVIGRSVHDVREAADPAVIEGLDYLMFGTVFETSSKPERQAAGLDALTRTVSATRLPVLAVGGVTLVRMAELSAGGVAGVASIGMFADGLSEDIPGTMRELVRVFATRDT